MRSNSNQAGSLGLRMVPAALAFGQSGSSQMVFSGHDFRDFYTYAVQLDDDPNLTLARRQDS